MRCSSVGLLFRIVNPFPQEVLFVNVAAILYSQGSETENKELHGEACLTRGE